MNLQACDAFMAIFGYRRIAKQEGNVLTPIEFEQCPTCGDHDCAGGLPCETGDGV